MRNGTSQRLAKVQELARRAGITVHKSEVAELDRLADGAAHQGVTAAVSVRESCSLEELTSSDVPLIVVLDGIEDPRNFGAVARAAEAAGVDGIVHQTRRSAMSGGAAAKAAAGALAYVRLAPVVNISRALDELKKSGIWTVGLDAEAGLSYCSIDLTLPTALVVGSEGTGLRRLVRERCDWLASIPMNGHISSLNASVAAGIVLFEAVRQRSHC
jgi:23S rRNA (guanosine2251-2'-O)-methyltransferase